MRVTKQFVNKKELRTDNTKSEASPLSGPVCKKLCSRWCKGVEVAPNCHTQLGRLSLPDTIEDQGRYRQTKRCSKLDVV